jgi:hypothetical protein
VTGLIPLKHVRRWREVLLEQPVHADLAAALPDFLKQTAQDFLADVPADLSKAQVAQLNRWYGSSAGQGALVEFTTRLWDQMAHFAAGAMPGHDARHAMYKVPAASLEYMVAEQVEGWERVGVLGALLHDHGRWAEERIFGWPGASVLHARLSYLLGRELLEPIEMPVYIKQQILMAAIRHTSGATPIDPMPLKLTVSADRDQLYGPEIILRMAHHATGRQGGGSSYYGERPGRTVFTQLERYLTHRLPGPLFSRDETVNGLWRVLANFLLIAEEPDASCDRFERYLRERGGTGSSRPFEWITEFARAERWRGTRQSPEDALTELLGAAHIAPSADYRRAALEKLASMTPANRPRLASALHYANEARVSLDEQQFEALGAVALANAGDAVVTTLTGLLSAKWFGHERLDAAGSCPDGARPERVGIVETAA